MTQPPANIIAAAEREMIRTKIPASFQLGQYALESTWGKNDLGCFNYFGMKCPCDAAGKPLFPFVIKHTREQHRDGSVYFIDAPFRKFSDPDEAFAAHADLLCRPIYAPAKAHLPNLDAYIDAVSPVYATGLAYANSIKAIIHGSNLTQYDGAGA